MRLDEVLPELMGSLALSELLFRGEGPPWACRRMDQYQRKMRKPVGSKGIQGSEAGSSPPTPLPSTLTHVCPHPHYRLPTTTRSQEYRLCARHWATLCASCHFSLSSSLETMPRYYHSVSQTGRLRPREIRGLAEPGVQQQWVGSGATCLSTR